MMEKTIRCADCDCAVVARSVAKKYCAECKAARDLARNRAYQAENREMLAAKSREYGARNREAVLAKNKAYRAKNIDEARRRELEYSRANAERKRQNATAYYWANREAVLAKRRSPEGREYARNKMRERLEQTPGLKVHSNVSGAIRRSLADKNRRPWEALVGYSLSDLTRHLERQFLKGMSWENYGRGQGKWHIDHITPRSSFNFETADDPEFRACWALTNLRPMWGHLNIQKHAKRTHLL